MRQLALKLIVATLMALPVVGCAESEEVSKGNGGKHDEGQGASGGDDTFGEGGGGAGDTTATGGAGGEAPAVCPDATGVYEATPANSNVLFLFDRSGSMHLTIDPVTTRWMAARDGLFQFLDSLPASTNAGLEMFPKGDAPIDCCVITADNDIDCGGCAAGELPGPEARCDASAYGDPTVSQAPMTPAHRQAMKDFVSSSDDEFYWGTPMAPAVTGVLDYQTANAAKGVSSVVLITDGNPTSCDTAADPGANSIQRVVDAAASALAAPNPVRTFVIGVIDGDQGVLGASEANMSLIAEAGGTARYLGCEANDDCAYPVNVGNFEQDLKSALDAIALAAFDCTFEVPDVQGGKPDLDAVNITITANAQTTNVSKDVLHKDGWDYLPGHESVQLYGAACDLLKSDASAKVEVVVGCKTVEK